MNYAQQQRDPRRHLFGITTVVLLHLVVGYALLNGLARKVVDVLKKPLEVSIVEELKQAEHLPPPPKSPPPRKVIEPPPAFVPPPEVQVQAAPAPSVVVATTQVPPVVEPVRPAPPVANVGVACPNSTEVRAKTQYPQQALRMGITGEVLVEFTVGAGGEVRDVEVLRSSNRVFNTTATAAVTQFRCVGQGQAVRVQVPFVFQLR